MKKSVFKVCAVLELLLLAAVFCVGLSGCKSSVKDDGIKYIIGISQANLLEPERIAMNDEIRTELLKYPDAKAVFYDAADSSEKQVEDIENMMKQKINLLIISPIKDSELETSIKEVYDSGVPVIIIGYPLENESYTMRIYSDNKKIGNIAGDYVEELLGPNGGTVLEIQGEPAAQETKERRAGFREATGSNPGIHVEYVVVGYWLRDKTIINLRTSGVFDMEPKIDIIYAHNDAMAIGARRLTVAKKTTPVIIGIGGLQGKNGGLLAVKNGIIDVTFLNPTGGVQAVRYAIDILKGKDTPKYVELKTQIVTKDNVEQFIKDNEQTQ